LTAPLPIPVLQSEREMERSTVFVSYSRADKDWLKRLQVHLAPLERDDRIKLFDDTKIKAGSLWRDELRNALESARVAVLLVSPNFLSSKFIAENELPPLLRAARENGATILPVILGPCLYEECEELGEFQAVNDPKTHHLLGLSEADREQVLLDVALAVRECMGNAASVPEATKGARPTPWPGSIRNPVEHGLQVWGQIDETALRKIRSLEVMRNTPHSLLQKCVIDDEPYVLKATREKLCDIEALKQLVAIGPRPGSSGGGSALPTMGTPRAVWIDERKVCELQPFYDAPNLADVVLKDRKPLSEDVLYAVVDSVADVLEVLYERGLIHGDINPGNILLFEDTHDLRIVDWSSCRRQSSSEAPFATPGYVAPEQEGGKSMCESDWYSLGATCFALTNGFILDQVSSFDIERGIDKIRLMPKDFRGWSAQEYFRGLLRRDPSARSKPWEPKGGLFDIRRVSQPFDMASRQRRGRSADDSWFSRIIERFRDR
jgi:serine/threonine protein kinase